MPISRCVICAFCGWCTNSTGSSMVSTWQARVLLMWSIIAASVVDLPEPVGPVTSTRPARRSDSLRIEGGHRSSSSVRILVGMVRKTAARPVVL